MYNRINLKKTYKYKYGDYESVKNIKILKN